MCCIMLEIKIAQDDDDAHKRGAKYFIEPSHSMTMRMCQNISKSQRETLNFFHTSWNPEKRTCNNVIKSPTLLTRFCVKSIGRQNKNKKS